MAVSIPEELRTFGITSKEFAEKKKELSKSAKAEVEENDVIWGALSRFNKKGTQF